MVLDNDEQQVYVVVILSGRNKTITIGMSNPDNDCSRLKDVVNAKANQALPSGHLEVSAALFVAESHLDSRVRLSMVSGASDSRVARLGGCSSSSCSSSLPFPLLGNLSDGKFTPQPATPDRHGIDCQWRLLALTSVNVQIGIFILGMPFYIWYSLAD